MQGGAAIVLPPRLAGSRGWIWMERSLCAGRIPYPPGSRRRGVRGRGMPLPYMASGHDRPNGLAAAARASVGRDALIPPGPAAGQGSAGGINPAPTGKFCVSGKPGGRNVCPGLQGRATALPQGSAAGQAGPIWNRPLHGVFAAARGLREGHAPPLHAVRERPAKWDCRGRPGERRAGCPHPAGPRGGGNVPGFEFQRCGGRERPPYGPGKHGGQPGKCNPRGHCKPM